jgi:transposase
MLLNAKRRVHYVGFDVHKKTIRLCVQNIMGEIRQEKTIPARPKDVITWAEKDAPKKWIGALEATVFSHWVYDTLKPYALELHMGHPKDLKGIGKHKSDQLDAITLCNLIRADYFPSCYVAPPEVRRLRNFLRYRNTLMRELVRFKNKMACFLMSLGVTYNKRRLHGKKYFQSIVEKEDLPVEIKELLKYQRLPIEFLTVQARIILRKLKRHPGLKERMERLQTIPGIGPITALTWILEVWDPNRFPKAKNAHSYCGLCGARKESGGKERNTPISKDRNAHLQWVLIEAAKVAVKRSERLRIVYEKVKKNKNVNAATISVARKLVNYLLAVDKSKKPFVEKELNNACWEKFINKNKIEKVEFSL